MVERGFQHPFRVGEWEPGYNGRSQFRRLLMADVGQSAPDFMLMDQNQKEVTLSQYKGNKNVVLSWHVHSFTGG